MEMLAWAKVASPVGELTLVASESGLVRVGFATENAARILARVQECLDATSVVDCSAFLSAQRCAGAQSLDRNCQDQKEIAVSKDSTAERFASCSGVALDSAGKGKSDSRMWHRMVAILKQAHAQMDEYFGGTRLGFDVPLDMALLSGFRLEVIHAIQRIPFGQVRSYGDVAAMTGHPGAARAVGTACRMNPLPLVVPCHRVIKADGTIGGYTPGLQIKHHLLALEGVDL